jgi:hypothetical protein
MENMLMAEGFVEAKPLAKKFASLYCLLEDLLSPAKHYDWGLRAIKSVLVVAGSLLRAEAGQVCGFCEKKRTRRTRRRERRLFFLAGVMK